MRHQDGDNAEAAANLNRAREIYHDIGYRLGEAEALNAIGELMFTTGAIAESRARHEEALAIATAITSRREQARALEGISKCR